MNVRYGFLTRSLSNRIRDDMNKAKIVETTHGLCFKSIIEFVAGFIWQSISSIGG